MFLKSLVIKETRPVVKVIRRIPFNIGMNFIVDAGKDQEKGNSVGKTTVLKLIDICLGSKEKKFIYFDDETKQTNEKLKNYIIESKINVELEVIDSFETEKPDKYVLSVDLYPNGRRYINGVEKKQEDYWRQLNSIFFSNKTNSPTFRQLIGLFVRVDQKEDNHKFLKFLNNNVTNATYTNIYSYMFELQDQTLSNQILDLKNKISEKNKELKTFETINNLKSIDSINQKILLLKSKIDELNNQMGILINSEKFKENEEKISEIKVVYANYNDQIDELLFRKNKISNILTNAKQEINNTVNKDILKNLYNETLKITESLQKEFVDLVNFNDELTHNKIRYFDSQLENINKKINSIKEKKEHLFEKHNNIIMLIEDNKIDEYTSIQKQLAEYNEDLGANKKVSSTYNHLNSYITNLNTDLEKYESKAEVKKDSLTIFNTYFSNYSEKTNGEPFMIYNSKEGFPIAIDSVKKGLSTGTKKSIIVAFDLAYQQLARDLNKKVPNFIVHDVIETIDQVALKAIIEIVKLTGSQYIVAVLKEKIEDTPLVTDSDIAVELSEKNKLFKN